MVANAPRLFVAIVAGFISLLGGCGENGVMSRFMLKPDHIIIERHPDPAYDQLFPRLRRIVRDEPIPFQAEGRGRGRGSYSHVHQGRLQG